MEHLVPPELSEEESYHVFCSYSNTDQQWTHALIQQLEDSGLTVCNNESDFTPGRSILENMSESIQQSQKVLLFLSAEFLRSRWCLLEANMSLFRDCLQRKPIVPVLLQRDVSIPLHLSHLTYLDVQSPDFLQQLLRVLCTPNQEMQASTVVPYQPPSLYNGKSLEPLPAVNEEQLNKFDCGLWSDCTVPHQLRLIIQQPERYSEAMKTINKVSQKKVKYRSSGAQAMYSIPFIIILMFCAAGIGILYTWPITSSSVRAIQVIGILIMVAVVLWVMYKIISFMKSEPERILRELQKAVGKANSLLFEEKILMGAQSNSQLLLVYVCLDSCRQELSALSQDQEHFHKAMLKYSSAYTCCLTNRYFNFQSTSSSGHLKGTVCFCQYTKYQLSIKKRCICC